MKQMVLMVLSLFVFSACQTISTNNNHQTESPEKTLASYISDTPTKPKKLPEEGKKCGGIQKTPCTLPLFCITEKDSPTGEGTCQNLVIDQDLNCKDEVFKRELPQKDPVCAIIKNQKHTFLNACEAARRGANTFTKGFCKPDQSIKNNCQSKAAAIGVCASTNEAWEFDGQKCVQRFITGCAFEIPFATELACNSKCL